MDKEGKKSRYTKKNHVIMLLVDTELYKKLKKESEKLHTPVSTLIRLWIAEKILEIEGKHG